MRILIDCNVLLDVMDKRQPHYPHSAAVFNACESGLAGAIAWHSVANAYYLSEDKTAAKTFFHAMLAFLQIVGGDTARLQRALTLPMTDFEDALQAVLAEQFQADYIVTRNTDDFKRSPVPALTPQKFLATA